jgi:hypothetical protein
MRLARQLIRVQRPDESLSEFVHNMGQAYDDLNESCLMSDGLVVMLEHFLSIFIVVGMSQEGPYGQGKLCIVNAFDPLCPFPPVRFRSKFCVMLIIWTHMRRSLTVPRPRFPPF